MSYPEPLPHNSATSDRPYGPAEFAPGLTFDTFIVGPSNELAHMAARAVAKSPAGAYNPLYIYGGTGLGKTHLLCAISHQLHQLHPGIKVLYCTAERFMNELITVVRNEHANVFREKFRHVDVLMIDDIQFIAGKERTQEEMFHTFNALYNNQKQIVLSSDCSPKQLPHIEERLVSRFQWGLIAEVEPPDHATSEAILRQKAKDNGINIDPAVISYIAGKGKSNIRSLEGLIIRLAAQASFSQQEITLALAQKLFGEEPVDTTVTIEKIQDLVASHFGLRPADLQTATHMRRMTLPRQIAMYLSKQLTDKSFPAIGRAFGGKHHTTVMHSCTLIGERCRTDAAFKDAVDALEKRLRGVTR